MTGQDGRPGLQSVTAGPAPLRPAGYRVTLSAPELASLTTALDHVTSCVLLPLDPAGRAELDRLRLRLAAIYLGVTQ